MKWPNKTRPKVPLAAYFVLAQAVIVIAAIIRVKAVTLLFGAQGIALYGIVANLTQIGSHVSAFGMHSSGVRSVAKVRDEPPALEETVGLYFFATSVFTTIATIAVPTLAWWGGLFDGMGPPAHLVAPLIGGAILLAAIATAQGTVFKGIGAARVVVLRNIVMPVAGVLLGLIALFVAGLIGVSAFFIFDQMAGVILSAVLWRRTVQMRLRLPARPGAGKMRAIVKPMLLGGGVFLVSSLVVETTILFGRWSLQHIGEIDELAFLNASWVLVTMSYGFMQGVMSTWLYPILTHAAHKDDSTVSHGVDTVVFLTGTLGAAFVMAVAPFAPLILRLVYSEAFVAATPDFNLALIGLLAQLVAAPILYLLLSRGHDKIYLVYHLAVGAIFAGGIAVSAAISAHEVLTFYVAANWIGVSLLVIGLHLAGQFSLRPRTLLVGGVSLVAAVATAHFGQSGVVRSVFFPVFPLALLGVAFLILRNATAERRLSATSGDDPR